MMEYWKLHISDIIQKTKLKIDEDGLEASAATSFDGVMMGIEKRPKYKIFTADKPFSFYIYTNKEEDIEPQLICKIITQKILKNSAIAEFFNI